MTVGGDLAAKEVQRLHPALRYLSPSGAFYVGLLLVAMAISRPLGLFMFALLFVLFGAVVIRLLLRLPGVSRGLPTTFHNLGDPGAWRGEQ